MVGRGATGVEKLTINVFFKRRSPVTSTAAQQILYLNTKKSKPQPAKNSTRHYAIREIQAFTEQPPTPVVPEAPAANTRGINKMNR